MNIIEYAETFWGRFADNPFNSVDSLVLSQLAYVRFGRLVPRLYSEGCCRICQLLKAEEIPGMLQGVRAAENNRKLLLALGMNPRFRDIKMCFHVDSLDRSLEKQFSAVTFLLDDSNAYIAFRGTDANFIGWKEDFNMAFVFPVPAQQDASLYLTRVAQEIPHRLMLGGHSKGGNLAVYAAIMSDDAVWERISAIYSHDGPGFREEVFKSDAYARIKGRVQKTLPQSSLVGMLFQNQEEYHVVKSHESWFLQHDPFSWEIEGEDFCYADKVTSKAMHLNRTLNQWVEGLSDDERELFVSTLYRIIEQTGAENIQDMSGDWYRNAATALRAAGGLAPETRRFLSKTLRSLAVLSVKNLFPER